MSELEPSMTKPNTDTTLVEQLQRQVTTCADSYEAPSGKIMLRVWVVDQANLLNRITTLANENALLRAKVDELTLQVRAHEIGIDASLRAALTTSTGATNDKG